MTIVVITFQFHMRHEPRLLVGPALFRKGWSRNFEAPPRSLLHAFEGVQNDRLPEYSAAVEIERTAKIVVSDRAHAKKRIRPGLQRDTERTVDMQIAFGIVSLFLNGGLQRNCVAIARILRDRGHQVTLFAARSEGALPSDLSIKMMPNGAWTNHGIDLQFARDFSAATTARFHRVVGFNKMFGLDVLYCADPPSGGSDNWRRFTPRYRTRRTLESSSFSPNAKAVIIALSQAQIEAYTGIWGTPPERFRLLPPNLERSRAHPESRTNGSRERSRASLWLAKEDWCWLAIGRQPRTKGFDRAIAVLPAFPNARLIIMGLDSTGHSGRTLLKLAHKMGVANQLTLLGFVPDEEVPSLMAAADLLIHPARSDVTGTVIVEAIVNGLPVVTTAACGYASHVRKAQAGVVLADPFTIDALFAAMSEASDPDRRAEWSANGVQYGDHADLFSGLETAADIITGSTSH